MFIARPKSLDPFVDLISQIRPQAMLWAGTDAAGSWGLSFRKRNDLLFCWMEEGACQLLRPECEPVLLQKNDFVLIQTSSPFTLTSDPSITPIESEKATPAGGRTHRLKLGSGNDLQVILHGGKFVFDSVNEHILMNLLPALVHVSASDESSWRLRSLLKLNQSEFLQPGARW